MFLGFSQSDIPTILKTDHIVKGVVRLAAVLVSPDRLERDEFGGEFFWGGCHGYAREMSTLNTVFISLENDESKLMRWPR